MKQISNKKYEAYQQYQTDMLYGRILTPDGLRMFSLRISGLYMMSRELPQSGVPSIFEPFALKQKIKQYPPAHNEPMGCLCDLYLPRFRTDNSYIPAH